MTTRTMAVLMLAMAACNQAPEPEPEVTQQCTAQTQQTLRGLSVGRTVLEVMGLLPSYDCGPLAGVVNAVGQALPPVSLNIACASMQSTDQGLLITFAEGCSVAKHHVEGRLQFQVSTTDQHVDVSADFSQLRIDGHNLPVRVGYGVCGDEKRVWLTVAGPLPDGQHFALDARAAIEHQGLPLIGHTEVTVDGTGTVSEPEGDNQVVAEGLRYEVGDQVPTAGQLTLSTAQGRTVTVVFDGDDTRVELRIDGYSPVKVPITP